MSCTSCGETIPSNPCGQYNDCGCINPTSLDCVTVKKPLPNLDVEKGDNAEVFGDKVEAFVGEMNEVKGKVKINESDTCPGNLFDKLEPGANVSFSIVGTGCEKKVRIDSTTGGVVPDSNVRVSDNDTTSGRLSDKIQGGAFITKSVVNPGANEKLKLDLSIDTVISQDAGNMLVKGTDGKLKTSYTAPTGAETKIVAGAGAKLEGSGTPETPYIVSLEGSIFAVKPCYDGQWKTLSIATTGTTDVTAVGGTLKYRVRFDGTVEFKGMLGYTVKFGPYSTSTRRFSIPVATLPTTCITATEMGGTFDLKTQVLIDTPQTSDDQLTQMYGYVIKKTNQNITIDFQSSFSNPTTKTIYVAFDGSMFHPEI